MGPNRLPQCPHAYNILSWNRGDILCDFRTFRTFRSFHTFWLLRYAYAHVAENVALLGGGPSTPCAYKGLLAGVQARVVEQAVHMGKGLFAHLAHIGLLASVRADVHDQRTFSQKALATVGAPKRAKVRVTLAVGVQLLLTRMGSTTHFAFESDDYGNPNLVTFTLGLSTLETIGPFSLGPFALPHTIRTLQIIVNAAENGDRTRHFVWEKGIPGMAGLLTLPRPTGSFPPVTVLEGYTLFSTAAPATKQTTSESA